MLCARFDIMRDDLHIIDHQEITSYKEQMDDWIQEALRRLQNEVTEDRKKIKRQIIELVNEL